MRHLQLLGLVLWIVLFSSVAHAAILMGDWKLWQIHDGIAPDSSGNGMNGVVYGNPTIIPGMGASFDGVNNYIEIPNTEAWNFATGFIIQVSFNTAPRYLWDAQDTPLVCKHQSGIAAGYGLGITSLNHGPPISPNDLFVMAQPGDQYIGGSQFVFGGTVVTDGQWHVASGAYDGQSLTLSVGNGSGFDSLAVVNSKSPWQYDSFSPYNIRIGWMVPGPGGWGYDDKFAGTIGEVRIYSGSAPEPSTLTLLGVGVIGLAAYRWRRRQHGSLPG